MEESTFQQKEIVEVRQRHNGAITVRLLVLSLGLILLAPTAERLHLKQIVQEADSAFLAGDYALASVQYQAAFRYQPTQMRFFRRRLEADLLAGNFEAVLVEIQSADRARALTTEEYRFLIRSLVGLGRIEDAVAAWREAGAAGQRDPALLAALVDSFVQEETWDQANLILLALVEAEPANAEYRYRLGLIQALDQPDPALLTLTQLIADNPVYAQRTGDLLATVRQRSEQPLEAYYTRLGIAYLGLDELTLARESFRRAFAYNARFAEALAYFAYTNSLIGEPSVAAIQHAISLEPNNPTVLYLAGLTWQRLDRPVNARIWLERAYDIDPSNPALSVEIASTHRLEGEREFAEVWMKEAVRLGGSDPRFAILLLQFYVDDEYKIEEEALPLALALASEYPENAEVQDGLGWVYFLLEDQENAGLHIDNALRLNPGMARAHFHRAVLYESQGRRRDAFPHYQAAAELEPRSVFGLRARRALERFGG